MAVHRKAPKRARFNMRAGIEAALQAGLFGAEVKAPETTPAQEVVVRSHVRHIAAGHERRKKRLGPASTRRPLQDLFREFHAVNPRIYVRLVEMARALKARGVSHYGIAALFEVLRYEAAIGTSDPSGMPFKLNNNYRAYYARMIHEREPELAGFFRTRRTQ